MFTANLIPNLIVVSCNNFGLISMTVAPGANLRAFSVMVYYR
jgi:hypothetical protein